jgi:membrane-bound lytic murein transglycosylase B
MASPGSGGPARVLVHLAALRAAAVGALGLAGVAPPAAVLAPLAALATVVANAPMAAAEDFTFRRVGVPRAGSADRITVQIDPTAPRRASAPAAAPRTGEGAAPGDAARDEGRGGGGAATPAGVEWFWTGVSPFLADSGPGRLAQALDVMAEAPRSFAAPRLQGLQDIAAAHGQEILRATVGTRVSPALVLAVISVESSGRANAVSSAGAAGLMQLMPATAERFGVADRLEAAQSIQGGVAYLDWLLGRFGGDPILAIAAYNAGEGAVDSNGGVPPFAETRAYVPKVLAAWTVARSLCRTPPELIGDGCVFAVGAS